jgi:vanillate O-demethylase monooxygenase subunit
MRWDAPALMLLDVGITPVGRPRDDGIWVYGTDVLTPCDEFNTYYFWGISRNHKIDNPAAGEQWTQAIDAAFVKQDKLIIEAQQRMIRQRGGVDIDDIDKVFLTTDAGPVRCRKVLRELIETEQSGALPDPKNPSLSELIDTVQYTHRVEPLV